MHKSTNKQWLRAVGLAVVCAAVLTVISLITGGKTGPVSGAVNAVASPVRTVVSAFAERAETAFSSKEKVQELEDKVQELKTKIATMEDYSQKVGELEAENEKLKNLLDMQSEHTDMELAQAEFMEWTSTNYTSQFTVSAGSSSGIEAGDCVITPDGYLVGTVSRVNRGSSTVTTVFDAGSSISVTIGTSEVTAIAESSMEYMARGYMKLSYIADSTQVRTGDLVSTRKGSSVYPEGLVIGEVVKVVEENSGLGYYAIIKPSADFDMLGTLYVVTDWTRPEDD